jgi:hypothetical protein
VLVDATAVRRSAAESATFTRARELSPYDILVGGLLIMVAAARLWLVPGYFRADSWLALVAGRDVSASGVPHHESLTAIAAGGHWVDQQWLGQLVTYGLYRAGGLPLVAIIVVLLSAGAFAAPVIAARRLGARARTVLFLMPLTLFPFFAQSWQPRTQSFAYPLFTAVFLLLLYDARRPSRRVLLVLPLLAVWGNVHGSVVLGAALVTLRGCLLLWERRGRDLLLPLGLMLLPPVMLLATPYGTDTAGYYRSTLLEPSFKDLATEWQPITHDLVLLVPFGCLAILIGLTLIRGRAQTTLWDRLAALLLLAAAASAVRNMVWLSLGALPVLAVALDRIVPDDPPATALAAGMNRMVAAAGVVAMGTALAVTAVRPEGDFEKGYPAAYLEAVRHAAALDSTSRIVADVGDADWLLWHDPSLRGRIAFDARLELLSAARVHDVASLLGGSAGGSLRGSYYRVFALDRRAATQTVAQLEDEPARRILFEDRRRIVVLLRHERPQ